MGLTIHYGLTAPDGLSTSQAAALVRRLHASARRLISGGRIARVLPISSDPEDLDRFACAWRILHHPEMPDTTIGHAIPPEAGWLFPIDLGEGSELLWLGLCRYSQRVTAHGQPRATRLGTRWRFSGFCKTQYASIHGWEHFARCHLAAIDLLAQWRKAGMRVRLNDEGGYWPHRRLATLRERLDQMNGIVAALGGALKDASDDTCGAPIESPIFSHPHFERLEAEGLARNVDHIAEAVTSVLKS